jgi:hypothetical protein
MRKLLVSNNTLAFKLIRVFLKMDDNHFQFYDDEFSSKNEDDDASKLCEPINSILSFEDYNELMNSEQPGVLEWKDYPSNFEEVQNVDVRITFDEAT